jgi:hypothetical protein
MKLAGFLALLALMFIAAWAVGARFGPLTTGHSPVQYTGGGGSTMNMGGTDGGGMDMSGMSAGGSP